MEAGIEPAPPTRNIPSTYDTAVNLCNVRTILIQNLKTSYSTKEWHLITELLSTVNSHMVLNLQTINYIRPNGNPADYYSHKIKQYNSYIWKQLTTPLHSTEARRNIFNFLTNLENSIH
jgi:hypothetical protein